MRRLLSLCVLSLLAVSSCVVGGVPEQTIFEVKSCDGVTTGFSVNGMIYAATDVKVVLINAAGSPYTTTVLTPTTHYAVSVTNGRYPATAFTVTTVSAYASGYQLLITTDIDLTETLSLSSDQWSPAAIQSAIWKSRLIDNEMDRRLRQCIRNPDSVDVNATTVLGEYGDDGYVYRYSNGNIALLNPISDANVTTSWSRVLQGDADGSQRIEAKDDLGLDHMFDVRDKGAVGDGVTDDAAAFQATIDAAIAAGGGVVVVPSTDAYYLLDGDIDLDGAVNLVVQGLGNPRLHRSGDDEAAAAFIIDDGTGSKIVFAGLRLTSTAVYHQSAAKNAIKLVGASASDISDVTIRDCQFDGWHKGIYGANMERLIVDGCTFANLVQIDTNTNGYGVLIERVYDVKIVHNSFSGTVMRHAVYTNTNTRELLIQGNEFIGNTDAAYLPTGYEMRIKILNCDSCVIDDNVFHDGMTPIVVDGTGDSIAVTGNICDGTEGLIWVVANNTTRSILVADNIVNADGVDAQAQYTGARGALRFQATASGSHVTVHDNIILSDDMAILADPEMTLSVVGNQLVYTGSSAPYGWALRSMTATAQITFGANTIRGYGYAMRNGVQTASGNTLVSCTGLSSNPASGSVLRGNYPDAQNVFNASISVKNGTTSAGYIDFYEDGDDGTSKIRLIGPALAGDVTLTLPATAGTNGYFLKTNGSGVLDWAAIAGGGDMLASTYDQDTNGDIDVAAGGTDKSSWTQYAIPYLSGATAFGEIGIGTAGQYLKVAAGATGYEWGTPTAGAADADLDDLADGSLSASKVAGVADADYGDVTVSGGVWAVEDDSHSHSGYQATVTEGSLANSVILSEDIKDGEVAVADLAAAAKTACVNFVIDGGGSAIATGIKGDFVIPFACTITGIAVLGDQSGSIVIDLWQGTIAEQIAGTIVDADSITASDPPTVSSAIGVDDDTLTDWDATVNALQVIRVNVDSCTTMTRCTLVLKLSKT